MIDVNSLESPADGTQGAAEETTQLPDKPTFRGNVPDGVIVIKRTTLFYGMAGLILFVTAYVIGFRMGTYSTAGIAQAVQQGVANGIAGLPINNAGNAAALEPPTEDPNIRYTIDVTGSPAFGLANAPITVVEFSDFQCPFCGQFFAQTEAQLLKKYEGKIRLVYRDFPLESIHPYAMGAAQAAQCANEQNHFWEYHDLLFQNQQQLTNADFLTSAKQLKLDMTTFQTCVDGKKYAHKIQNDLQAGENLNVSGTPTFFINGRKLVGAQPLAMFITYIDAELANPSSPATPARYW